MGMISSGSFVVKANGQPIMEYSFQGSDFSNEKAVIHIQSSSYEPIFWQFMAIGKSNKGTKPSGFLRAFQSDFSFLEELDNLTGRYLDNANFFSVEDPQMISDHELYDLLMAEYPGWVRAASDNGLILRETSRIR